MRARARGNNPLTVLPPVTAADQNELRNKIRQERRIELAMEHERFYDLVRWGIAKQALHAAGKTNFQENKNEWLPIPQVEIDKTQGALKQNPGY